MTAEAKKQHVMEFTEEQMQTLVRNALLEAGKEMGAQGDHWPVVKQTVVDVMRDWENLRIEREVHAEMKKHLYAKLAEMEQICATLPEDQKEHATPRLRELREVYDAFFADVENEELYLADDDEETEEKPLHIQRAEAIIDTLYEEDEQ